MKIDLKITYYYIVNMDLKMSRGKIAAQVSHVAMKVGKKHGIIGRSIVLKGHGTILRALMKYPNVEFVVDAGLTEVPKGSLTCVGFKKEKKNYPSEVAATLKLL